MGTKTTYAGPQKEIMQWCQVNGHRFRGNNKLLITEEKLLLFLKEQVVGRMKRKRGRKRESSISEMEDDRNDDHGDESENLEPTAIDTVGIQTYNNYVSAAVGIWKHQKLMSVRA